MLHRYYLCGFCLNRIEGGRCECNDAHEAKEIKLLCRYEEPVKKVNLFDAYEQVNFYEMNEPECSFFSDADVEDVEAHIEAEMSMMENTLCKKLYLQEEVELIREELSALRQLVKKYELVKGFLNTAFIESSSKRK